jgi:hypothetical protein
MQQRAQRLAQCAINQRRRSVHDRFGFTQRGDLQNSDSGATSGWLSGNRSSAIAEIFSSNASSVSGGRNIVAMLAPDRRLLIPGC